MQGSALAFAEWGGTATAWVLTYVRSCCGQQHRYFLPSSNVILRLNPDTSCKSLLRDGSRKSTSQIPFVCPSAASLEISTGTCRLFLKVSGEHMDIRLMYYTLGIDQNMKHSQFSRLIYYP